MSLSGSRVGVGSWGVLSCPHDSFIPREEEHGGHISRGLRGLPLLQGHALPQWSSDTSASKPLAAGG